jgi:hypothetical protein
MDSSLVTTLRRLFESFQSSNSNHLQTIAVFSCISSTPNAALHIFLICKSIASIPLRSRLRSASSQCYELPSFRLKMVNGVSHSPALQLGIRYRLLDLLNQTDTNFSFIVLLTIDFTSSFVNALLVT